ncbi:NAD-dependent protein deacylase [Acetanaerobacterium elongatum]|uniref:NAD-dependent protein deacetylase n=1 Tax=Acetanaerobacterium elongatum TaxID=258515 RepID=A0A1H0FGU0_9FIRM|nr:NAD-dependent protein deacylase [Acetanaerobacterium elongatum]SDN93804.1 NAD-dependent deacetylase [Acetanaerobacterium elongatum]
MNRELQRLIEASNNIVFFGGAGVSTESGIPDFRSPDGLYRQKYRYPPETMLSRSFFDKHTAEFYDFYRGKMLFLQAKPNKAHQMLAKLEEQGRLKAVITQNIDGLHQQAGSKTVLELHGSVLRNFCMSCGEFYPVSAILESEGIPRCSCGGIIKPDVVLYEEGLNNDTLYQAVEYLRRADMLIIGGTSLAVYPAAGLVQYYRGNKLVLINKSETPLDNSANLILRGLITEELGE